MFLEPDRVAFLTAILGYINSNILLDIVFPHLLLPDLLLREGQGLAIGQGQTGTIPAKEHFILGINSSKGIIKGYKFPLTKKQLDEIFKGQEKD